VAYLVGCGALTFLATYYSTEDGQRRYGTTGVDLLRCAGESLVALCIAGVILAGSAIAGIALAEEPTALSRIARILGHPGMPRPVPWRFAQVRAAATTGVSLDTLHDCTAAIAAYRTARADTGTVAWWTALRLRRYDRIVGRLDHVVRQYRAEQLDDDLADRARRRGAQMRPGSVLAVCQSSPFELAGPDPFLDRYTIRDGTYQWWRLIHAPQWLYEDHLAHHGDHAGTVPAAVCDPDDAVRAALLWQDEPTMPLHDPGRCIAAARRLERGRDLRRGRP
jgi:hypothetical protein